MTSARQWWSVDPVQPVTSNSPALPIVGTLVAAAVLFARRPDVLVHAQLYAEDGRIFFQDVYNLGIRRSIVLPQAGYFVTFAMLASWIARLFSVADAPFVVSALGLAAQALPVGLLLSRRAETVVPDLRVRLLIAFAYLLLPVDPELDATALNAQWFLALAALLVVLMSPPGRRWLRVFDGAILLLAGLTGPFVIVLAPIALVRRRTRGRQFVPNWEIVLLVVCAIVQLIALLIVSHNDATNPAVEPRPDPSLGATPSLFAALVGGRLFLGTLIGAGTGLTAASAIQWLALIAGCACVVAAVRSRRQELIMLLVFAGVILLGALVRPSTGSPAWPLLAGVPPNSQRYYILPELAWVVLLIWAAAASPVRLARLGAALVLAITLCVALAHWSFPRQPASDYGREAAAFAHAPAGADIVFQLDPTPWVMTLRKR